MPWQFTDQWRQLTEAVAVPTCTGEGTYLTEGCEPLLDARAIHVVHPDPVTSGGMAEAKRELVTDARPLFTDGYIKVPDTPGLGLGEINDELFSEHVELHDPFFAESTGWTRSRATTGYGTDGLEGIYISKSDAD